MTTDVTAAINALTAATTENLDVTLALSAGVAAQIAAAVLASENAAISPLVTVATNLIDMQAMLIANTTSALVHENTTNLALISIAQTTLANQTLVLNHIATGY